MLDNIKKARARMMIHHPFFATLMASTPWIETRDVPTAGTDMKNIYFNPDFMADMSVPHVMFVIAHEVMHMAWMHGSRLGGRNHVLWNIAGDYAINWTLKECGMDILPGSLIDAKYADMSAPAIYDDLVQRADKARKNGQTGNPEDGEGQSGMPGTDPLHGDVKKPGSGSDGKGDASSGQPSDAALAQIQQQVQQRVAQAASVARMAGKVPAGLETMINEILDPKVPWPDLLRDYMLAKCKDDESWSKRNRRFQYTYLPSRDSVKMGPIVIIGDSSGSMFNQDDLNKMAAEINGIKDMVNPEYIRLIWADTRVASEEIIEEGDVVLIKPKGGGGTDMRVPLRHVEQYEPAIVILITDGYTPWPDYVPYDLITVTTTTAEPPAGLGEVVRV